MAMSAQTAKPTRQQLAQIITLTIDDIQRFDHPEAARLAEIGPSFLEAALKNSWLEDGEADEFDYFANNLAIWQGEVYTFKLLRGPSRLPVFQSFFGCEPFMGSLCLSKKIAFTQDGSRQTSHINTDMPQNANPDDVTPRNYASFCRSSNTTNISRIHSLETRGGFATCSFGLLNHVVSLSTRFIGLFGSLFGSPQLRHTVTDSKHSSNKPMAPSFSTEDLSSDCSVYYETVSGATPSRPINRHQNARVQPSAAQENDDSERPYETTADFGAGNPTFPAFCGRPRSSTTDHIAWSNVRAAVRQQPGYVVYG